ncbi:uncharacterized protein LY89DRAFT_578525 [Mollisia scopiformis]|uniref:Uncharacterized protein n=1 Tax=Mollisia scopiformis TaxID=149040 RepID=A0A194XKD3_MOLSC|nr:uncharacterized protein LY89DRAFT_578525 [Mollisia scopiformis]KUJ20601.1 hypothetical protein LY89DRAFT_578525 [Mollisia scopiformis]
MEAQSLSTCNQCGKKFQRKAHLLRHQQQHSGDRPYSCKFCSKTFKRSDVLRDHFSRCEKRGSSAIPSSLERGRKRHACDECSRLKVKCDNNVPCGKCTEFGRKCVKTRSRLTFAITAVASSPEGTPNPSTPDTGSDRNSIGFLLNCPSESDFIQEFPKSTTLSPNSRPDGFSSLDPPVRNFHQIGEAGNASVYQEYGHMIQENNIDVLLSHLEFSNFEQQTNNWQMPGENMILWSGPDALFLDRGVLEQRAFDIRSKLKFASDIMNPPHTPPPEVLQALELITADSIAAWIKLYFRHWHKHAPMVHEATFNPCHAAVPLVLSLMSLGAMYSKETEHVAKLKMLLDTMEWYIFSLPGLNDEYELPGRTYVKQGDNASQEWLQYQLEELQGAYLMIVLQYWTGNAVARTRVRQQRFPRVDAIFHHLEVLTMQHSPDFEIKDQSSFTKWIRKESYIRTATLAIMLDHAFGIFNNVPPRFQWAEIDLPFPSDDHFFKTTNFEDMVAKSIQPKRSMKIKDAFLNLFTPPMSMEQDLSSLRQRALTALDMQMLIHFLYTHVWTSTFSNPMACLPSTDIHHLTAPFKTALHNWKLIWDEIKSSSLETEWNKLGFQRTAEAYFDAVNSILAVFEKREGKFPPIPSDCEKGSHLKRVLSF